MILQLGFRQEIYKFMVYRNKNVAMNFHPEPLLPS